MGWPRASSALIAGCLAVAGCGSLNPAPRVDVASLRAAIESQLAIRLHHAAPPPGQPGIPALRATFAGANDQEQVTVLEFFESHGTEQVLGSRPRASGITALERRNVVILYTRSGGPNHRALLARALKEHG